MSDTGPLSRSPEGTRGSAVLVVLFHSRYDDSGNRTEALEAGTQRNFAYTPDGLLCDVEIEPTAASCTGGNVTSDDAGRISDVDGWHFEYDAQARLVSACDSSACTGSGFDRVDYEYDGEGHRTTITETPAAGSPVVTTTFRYQGDAIVAEYRNATLYREYITDDTGTISKVIVPGGQTGAGTYLVTWNGHGDAMALYKVETSGALTLANSYTYGTWGRPTTATHNSIADLGFRFLYVGAADVQWDSSYGLDLLYMHARHYSPSLGRFLQPDPSRLDARLFVYALNGPVSDVDPSGLATYRVVAHVEVRDCVFPCFSRVLTALTLRMVWTTGRLCVVCQVTVVDYRATPTISYYRYGNYPTGASSGGWHPDPWSAYTRLVAGGRGRTYVRMTSVQGFKYSGAFSFWATGVYYNRLQIWITGRANGTFACDVGYYIRLNPPGPFSFQFPYPTCHRY